MIQLASQNRVTTLSKPFRHILHAARYFEALTGTLILNLLPQSLEVDQDVRREPRATAASGLVVVAGAPRCVLPCFALVTGGDRCNDQCRYGWHQDARHG